MKLHIINKSATGLVVFIAALFIIQLGCKKTEIVEPVPTPAPNPDLVHNFWYYAGGHYDWGQYSDTLPFYSNQFLHLVSDGTANVRLAELISYPSPPCTIYQTTYRRTSDGIILRYHSCLPGLTDSVLYTSYLSADSMVLSTRGFAHNNMVNNPDSIYEHFYFRAVR